MKGNTFKLTFLSLLSMASIVVSSCSKEEVTEKKTEQEEQGHSHDSEHDHGPGIDHTPHMGVMSLFTSSGAKGGYIELKLHDDKGDLELWLTKDEAGTEPFDLPMDSELRVSFPSLKKSVKLHVRNRESNEDEAGKANIRDNKTNYFIFPGDSGADASFLVGKSFSSSAIITFSSADTYYNTSIFKLRPHTH